MTLNSALFSSERDDWETPQSLFDKLNQEFHFTIDVASSDSNAKCEKHYTMKDNGLTKSWGGGSRFLQPSLWSLYRQMGKKGL